MSTPDNPHHEDLDPRELHAAMVYLARNSGFDFPGGAITDEFDIDSNEEAERILGEFEPDLDDDQRQALVGLGEWITGAGARYAEGRGQNPRGPWPPYRVLNRIREASYEIGSLAALAKWQLDHADLHSRDREAIARGLGEIVANTFSVHSHIAAVIEMHTPQSGWGHSGA